MDLRTGDILVWRSTNFYDSLSDNTIFIDGLHAGIVFVGEPVSRYSICGKSPTGTYVTFLVDQILPVEEVIGHIWHRPNGASLNFIRRTGGPDIDDEFAATVLGDMLALNKRPTWHCVYIAIAAYFRLGDLAPSTGHNNLRWNVCSMVIAYCLDRMGLLVDDAVPNNLLPIDFYKTAFYQRYPYEREEIFDKETHRYKWLFTGFLIRFGMVRPEPVTNPKVDLLLKDYDYPRDVRAKQHIRSRAHEYLIE